MRPGKRSRCTLIVCGRCGWTLMELLVVLTLLGVITAGAALTVRGSLRTGRVRMDVETALTADRAARSHARRFHRGRQLTFQWADVPTIAIADTQSGRSDISERRIDSLVGVTTSGAPALRETTSIDIDPSGRSPSYALAFAAPGNERWWIVMAGETGQPIFDLTREQVQELFHVLETSQSDP